MIGAVGKPTTSGPIAKGNESKKGQKANKWKWFLVVGLALLAVAGIILGTTLGSSSQKMRGVQQMVSEMKHWEVVFKASSLSRVKPMQKLK